MAAGRNRTGAARSYYRALDTDDYELLEELLTPGFTHVRPEMTIEGREQFVQFMREQRPQKDTSHPIDGVYCQEDGEDVVVRGRLLDPDDELLVRFVDVFTFEESAIAQIRTFTR